MDDYLFTWLHISDLHFFDLYGQRDSHLAAPVGSKCQSQVSGSPNGINTHWYRDALHV